MSIISVGFSISNEIDKPDPINTSFPMRNTMPENNDDWTYCLVRRFFHMLGFYDEPLYQHLKSLADNYLQNNFSMFVLTPPSTPYAVQWQEHEVYFHINQISNYFFRNDNIKVVEILAFIRAIRLLLVNNYCCEPFFCARELADKCERFVTFRLDNRIKKLGGWERIANKIKLDMNSVKETKLEQENSVNQEDSVNTI